MPLGDIDFNEMVLTIGTIKTMIEEPGSWAILFMQEVCEAKTEKTR